MIKKYSLVLVAFLCFILSGFGQVTIYFENMYNGTGGSSGNAITTHETNNRFNEDGLTYSGTGDMRTTNPSTGAGVYTGASGTWNVMLNANAETFIMDGLDLTGFNNITLSFGIRKSTVAENGSNLIVEYSTNGISGPFTVIGIPSLPTSTGTAIWHYRTSSSIIPDNATTIRFTSTYATNLWNIDDVLIQGIAAPSFDSCLFANFDNPADSGNLPPGFSGTGTNNTNAPFYQSAPNSRALDSGQTLRTPAMVRPAAIEFYVIGSGAGGQVLTLEYTNNGTVWNPLTTYNVTSSGGLFYYDSSALTSAEPVAAYRLTSGADTIYIDDLTVYCTCDLTDTGLANIACNNNGTNAITTDDYITFELNPTVVSSGSSYAVSVSSGSVTPTIANYGSATTFTLQNGSAGAGNVTVTITDGISGGCTLDASITDPGSCSVPTDQVDFCNVDFPENGTIDAGQNFTVYSQAYEPGVTDAGGAGAGLNAWIGYSTTNATTLTDFTSSDWTWISAPFNSQQGNNDQFEAQIGSLLPAGTYYYVSRFQLNGGPFSYGGKTPSTLNGGNFWNGTTAVSGVLTVNPVQVNFCNVEFPKNASIAMGNPHTVYAQVYEPGVTDAAGQGGGIDVEIGYNTIGLNHEPWNPSGWTWITASYNPSCLDCNGIQNDEYMAEIGSTLPTGTYYYASRFQLNGSSYSYGGIQSDNVGNFWDATNNNGVLTITVPPLADVVITEIMYNTTGNDDEWIEICNVSGSVQNLSGYRIRANGTIRFTFPIGVFIADGDCITIDLGDGGESEYNPGCPFTPDYSNGQGLNSALPNNPDVTGVNIELLATDNTIVDIVNYDDADGADGNGASIHVTDIGLDNSNTGTNWQEVINGGSAGINFLISSCTPIAPEIDVERNTSASIPSGSAANNGFNTIWATTNVGNSSNKTFFVRNEGFADLTVSSMTSSNNVDFGFVNLPTFPLVLAPGEFIEFEIEFTPSSVTPITKTSTITINNNDANESVYTFGVQGNAGCPLYTGNLYPATGPVGTEITITSNESQNLTAATATLNGISLTVLSSSTNELVVKVPTTVTTGGALVVTLSGGCTITNGFVLIDQSVSGCEGSGGNSASDIFISQVTDSGADSFTYIELYNGTGGTINLNNYSIALYNNGRSTPVNSNYVIDLDNVNLTNGTTYVVAIGLNDMSCAAEHNPSSLADQQYNEIGVSLNFSNNGDNAIGHDHLRLYNNTTPIDSWGEYENQSWATSLNLGGKAANFMRRNDVIAPNGLNFAISDWIVQEWGNTCADLDYSDIGTFNFSSGTPPSVSILTAPTFSCGTLFTTLSVTATEGFGGGNSLLYQWFYSAPGDIGWTMVPDNAIYDNVLTDTLQIVDVSLLDGYQFYCQVQESDATCYSVSNAIKLDIDASVWNGSISNNWNTAGNWTPSGVPTISNVVVIPSGMPNSPVLAGTPPLPPTGSPAVYAKSLVVLNNAILELQTGQSLVVENCIINNGTIDLKNTANLVQVNETDENSGNGNFMMQRIVIDVEPLNYIYWSSPIAGVNVSGIPGSGTHRYLWDPTAPNANGTDGNWVTANSVMDQGRGYIIRSSGASPSLNVVLGGNGLGTPHNGTFSVPISKGSTVYPLPADNVNNYWNLIGNPYPSAISADKFITENAAELMDEPSVLGTIYLWQHAGIPNVAINDPFYENFAINYDGSNYLSYNATGPNPNNGDFTGNIAAGQGFFIVMDEGTSANSVTFTNAMRYGDALTDAYNNSEFLRVASTSNEVTSSDAIERHRIWLDLIAPNNSAVSTLVGYVTGATNGKDRLYDGYETNSTGLGLYSIVEEYNMGIQGRTLPFDVNDTVPLGFNLIQTGTYTIAINQVDGLFAEGQTIYLEDLYSNTIHDLRAAPFTFQSQSGRFDDRFVLRYTNETLSVPDLYANTELTIFELPSGQVKFTVGSQLQIQAVEIIDMIGRSIYQLKGSESSEIYDLSNLSQAAYIAKVTLSNGQMIVKRAVKRY